MVLEPSDEMNPHQPDWIEIDDADSVDTDRTRALPVGSSSSSDDDEEDAVDDVALVRRRHLPSSGQEEEDAMDLDEAPRPTPLPVPTAYVPRQDLPQEQAQEIVRTPETVAALSQLDHDRIDGTVPQYQAGDDIASTGAVLGHGYHWAADGKWLPARTPNALFFTPTTTPPPPPDYALIKRGASSVIERVPADEVARLVYTPELQTVIYLAEPTAGGYHMVPVTTVLDLVAFQVRAAPSRVVQSAISVDDESDDAPGRGERSDPDTAKTSLDWARYYADTAPARVVDMRVIQPNYEAVRQRLRDILQHDRSRKE